jgi:hypothetical protein
MHDYSIKAVIGGVGWLTSDDEAAVSSAIPGGTINFEKEIAQLQLHWNLQAASLSSAVNAAMSILENGMQATGVYCPEARAFEVIRIGDH